MLSLTMKQKFFLHPSHLLRNKRDTANFDLEKPNFCQLLNLYLSFYLLGNLIQNNNFSGEIFAIIIEIFYVFIRCSFSKNSNLVKVSQKIVGGF